MINNYLQIKFLCRCCTQEHADELMSKLMDCSSDFPLAAAPGSTLFSHALAPAAITAATTVSSAAAKSPAKLPAGARFVHKYGVGASAMPNFDAPVIVRGDDNDDDDEGGESPPVSPFIARLPPVKPGDGRAKVCELF